MNIEVENKYVLTREEIDTVVDAYNTHNHQIGILKYIKKITDNYFNKSGTDEITLPILIGELGLDDNRSDLGKIFYTLFGCLLSVYDREIVINFAMGMNSDVKDTYKLDHGCYHLHYDDHLCDDNAMIDRGCKGKLIYDHGNSLYHHLCEDCIVIVRGSNNTIIVGKNAYVIIVGEESVADTHNNLVVFTEKENGLDTSNFILTQGQCKVCRAI